MFNEEKKMAELDNTKASATAVKDAKNMWGNFTKTVTVCTIICVVTLALMALFLV